MPSRDKKDPWVCVCIFFSLSHDFCERMSMLATTFRYNTLCMFLLSTYHIASWVRDASQRGVGQLCNSYRGVHNFRLVFVFAHRSEQATHEQKKKNKITGGATPSLIYVSGCVFHSVHTAVELLAQNKKKPKPRNASVVACVSTTRTPRVYSASIEAPFIRVGNNHPR